MTTRTHDKTLAWTNHLAGTDYTSFDDLDSREVELMCRSAMNQRIEVVRQRKLIVDIILDTMEFPPARRTDYRWLQRNLGINNTGHARLDEVLDALVHLVAADDT